MQNFLTLTEGFNFDAGALIQVYNTNTTAAR